MPQIFSDEEVKKLNRIVYDELRGILDVSKKLCITTIVLVSMHDYKMFADFLYKTSDINYWVERVNQFFSDKTDIKDDAYLEKIGNDEITHKIFNNFRNKVKEKYEYNDFFKSVFEKDDMALAVVDVCNSFDKWVNEMENIKVNVKTQLETVQLTLF